MIEFKTCSVPRDASAYTGLRWNQVSQIGGTLALEALQHVRDVPGKLIVRRNSQVAADLSRQEIIDL